MTIQWPDAMPEGGRLQQSESEDAFMTGTLRMHDVTRSCQQTLQISLFFDGTNNNDDANNPYPHLRDSLKHAHTNVARLFNIAIDDLDNGISRFYIPGLIHLHRTHRMINSNCLLRLGILLKGAAAALCLSLAACAGGQQSATSVQVEVPQRVRLVSGDSEVLNYTPWYIENFSIFGPSGSGIGGGGPGVLPVKEDGRPSTGGGVCCTSVPAEWQPNLKLTVRWAVDKKMDGKTPGYWYKAENVRIAQYDGANAGGIWTIFLPGDRVRFMVTDGNHEGGNNPNNRPADNDPYIVQGVLDVEWNRMYRRGGMQ